MIHPDLAPHLGNIKEFLDDNLDLDNLAPSWFKHHLDSLPITQHGNAISIPLLDPRVCDDIVVRTASANFAPNMDEEPDYRINELVLAPGERSTMQLVRFAEEVIWPLFTLLYGKAPNSFSSIQIARYGAPGPVGTGWHHDEDSEATCTVSLNPGQFTGGGTALRPLGGFSAPVCVPPLPQGHALLFNGRTTLHRGLDVTSGMRNLLVFWMKHV